MKRTEPGKYTNKTFEKRIWKDGNRFYNVQVRLLPLEDWTPNDGWGTVFITSSLERARARLDLEPGTEVD